MSHGMLRSDALVEGDYPAVDFYPRSRYIPFTGRGIVMTTRKRPKPVHQMTVAQFEATFPDEDACRVYLVARRWPKGVVCPRCGNPEVTELTGGFRWQCYQCAPDTSYRFSHL